MTKAYVLPFAVYLLGTSLIARFGDDWYPLLYGLLVTSLLVAIPLMVRGKRVIQPHWRVGAAIAFGIVGIGLWIILCQLGVEQRLAAFLPTWLRPGERVGFNPWEHLSGSSVWLFIFVRIVGIVIIVAVAEELFWRGFLLRWLIDPEWQKVPLGEFSYSSCILVTLMFTAAHPEWLAAATYFLLLQILFYWKNDLWLCIVAHGISNLILAVYVLSTQAWWLW